MRKTHPSYYIQYRNRLVCQKQLVTHHDTLYMQYELDFVKETNLDHNYWLMSLYS